MFLPTILIDPFLFLSMDRLSQLPHDVVDTILSYLPVSDVVRTSALSKSWRQVFSRIPVYDFQDPLPNSLHESNQEKRLQFLDFVTSRMLEQTMHNKNYSVRRLRISAFTATETVTFKFERLLRLALASNTTELVLENIPPGPVHYVNPRPYPLPILKGRDLMLFSPCLRALHLSFLCIDEWFFPRLASGCPLLESISLEGCKVEGQLTLHRRSEKRAIVLSGFERLVKAKFSLIDRVSIADTPNLRILHGKRVGRIDVDPLTAAPNVEVLKLKNFSIGGPVELGRLFPALKVLVVRRFPRKNIRISSKSLETLRLSNSTCGVSINTPNLKWLECGCGKISPMFPVNGWCLETVDISDLFRHYSGLPSDQVSWCRTQNFWFARSQVSYFKNAKLLTLCVNSQEIFFSPQFVLDRPAEEIPTLSGVEHLKLKICLREATKGCLDSVRWNCRELVEGLFWTCRPKLLTLTLGTGDNFEFIKILSEKLARRMEECQPCSDHLPCRVDCWRRELEDFSIECFGENNRDRKVFGCSGLLQSLPALESGNAITFTFGWYD